MKPTDPGFAAAVEIEHAKMLLDSALAQLESGSSGAALISVNTAIKQCAASQQSLLHLANAEFHRASRLVEQEEECQVGCGECDACLAHNAKAQEKAR